LIVAKSSKCSGCRLCEIACSLWHEGEFSPKEARIRIIKMGPDEYKVRVCKQCKKKVCISVCPEDAITLDNKGIIVIDETRCTGCKLCVKHCPFEAIWIHPKKRVAITCNLCDGGEPQCIAYCPMGVLKKVAFSGPGNEDIDKEQMSEVKHPKRRRGI
jgi:carbon-monoxide dehydrogenase iron sulfur subunit